MVKEDIFMFVGLVAVVVVLGLGMQAFHGYLQGDWRDIADCRQSYWTCTSRYDAKPIRQGRALPVFNSSAKNCEQYSAYESARRKAMFNCGSNRSVRRGSCQEVETRCSLPNHRLY